ncbi:glycosyltransferase family 2 protein [Alloacidobacterium dinghuense]|uniref:Glycosyltransferase family 2 protein n=1 Tax=Alloacidobacterium dinghuense TaxID=2763107 RepID=A0A7G8BGA5_9BACT|nr:glycosyltransferase family 2 protein [Alloacidobacterium dinghuense]QNI31575.1 glycosyltransferase family 2 protein [Alloacidobacterium dinghuense]
MKGKIGVVTVTYNSAPVLREFFESLGNQTHRNFVLYLVDNNSRDETLMMVRQREDLPSVVIANQENLGVAEGNNQGIRAAISDGCECVLLLNNDTIFQSNFIERLYSALDRHQCDMTTSKMYHHDSPKRIWCAGGRFLPFRGYNISHNGEGETDVGQFNTPRRVTYTPTCCLMAKATVFHRVGLMDSRYFVYSDDVDFLYRCLKNSVSLWYVPEAKLWHKVSYLTGNMSDFMVHYSTRNRIYFVRKHLPFFLALLWYWQAQLQSTVAFAVRHIKFSRWNLRVTAARDGWKMLAR